MADVGLDSELVLDVQRALRAVGVVEEHADRASNMVLRADTRQVTAAIEAALASIDTSLTITGEAADVTSEITAAVDAADAAVLVTGDAAELTGEITAAVDAADSDVLITGDAADVTGSIDGAVDAADTGVVITGTAQDVTGSINGAVQAADTNIEITADTSQAQAQVAAIGTAASTSTGGVLTLKGALAGLAALGIGGLLVEVVNAASDIGESASKAATVFGDSFSEIEVFAADAATAVGLTAQAAFEATGTFGNLFQALGVSQDEAVDLSQDVVQLGADLASFNNLEVGESLEKLRSGLVGEIEPLRSLGISFNAADVERRAFELGLGTTADELTEGEKVLARYSLIAEQSSLATGDFARTSDGLANQSRILKAELGNLAAEAGQQLLPTVLDLVTMAREELVPRFGELADKVLPAVADALVAVAPLAGSFLDVLILTAPILQVIADVLGAIPTELLTFATMGLLAGKGMQAAAGPLGTFVTGLGQLGPVLKGTASGTAGLPGMVTGLLSVNPLLLAGGAILGGFAVSAQMAAKRKAEFAEEVKQATESLRGENDMLIITGQSVGEFIATTSKFADQDALDHLRDTGSSLAEIGDLALQGEAGVAEFVEQLHEAGKTDGEIVALSTVFREVQAAVEEAARAELDRMALQGPAEAAIVATAEANHTLADGTVDVVAAIDESNRAFAELRREQALAAAEAQRVIDVYGPLAAQYVGTAEALGRLEDTSPRVTQAIRDIRLGTDDTQGAFLDFVVAADEAALSEDAMGDAAALLGVDVGTLTGAVDGLADSLNTFVDGAIGKLPTIASVFAETASAVEEGATMTAAGLVTSLTNAASDIADFRADLALLTEGGFADLAGIIAEQGPEVGGALADELAFALADGNVEILEGVREATDTFEAEWNATSDYFRTTLGPEFILTTGLLGSSISEVFGENLDFGERLRISAELGATALDESGQAIAAVAAVEGDAAAQAYGDAMNLDQAVIDEAIVAGRAIRENAPTDDARAAGQATFEGFAQGMEGLNDRLEEVAARLARNAVASAARVLKVFSPSQVMRELGRMTGEGMALGIEDKEQRNVDAAASVAGEIIAAFQDVSSSATGAEFGVTAAAVTDAMGGRVASAFPTAGIGGDSVAGTSLQFVFEAGAFPGVVDAETAREVAGVVGDTIADKLARRAISSHARVSG